LEYGGEGYIEIFLTLEKWLLVFFGDFKEATK